MKERPILFSAPMVLAILDWRKTQTRRVMHNDWQEALEYSAEWKKAMCLSGPAEAVKHCPYGQPGDRLWVKETWRVDGVEPPPGQFTKRLRVRYRADDARIWFEQGEWPSGSVLDPEHWTPSIHMPRWASRITLEVTAVRVERLQDITEYDAKSEGCSPVVHEDGTVDCGTRKTMFAKLWDSINGKAHPWASNPWVWVIEFRRIKP